MTTFPATGPLEARVRFHGGTLDVDTDDGGSAWASVEALDPDDERSVEAARNARIDCSGGRLVVDIPGKGKWRGGVKVAVRLVLPPLSRLTSESGEVTLRATGELQDVSVRTGTGDIVALDVRGTVDVKAGDAHVTVGSPRRVSFTTGNGSLRAEGVGDVTFKTGHGTATLASSTGTVIVKGGSVALELGAATSGDVLFQTGAGNARIGVTEGTTVQLDLQSALGDVRCDLPIEDGPPSGGPALKLKLVTGLGDLVVARA